MSSAPNIIKMSNDIALNIQNIENSISNIRERETSNESHIIDTSASEASVWVDNDVPMYESIESIDEKDMETSPEVLKDKPKKANTKFEWEFKCEFPNAPSAKASLDSAQWSRYRKSETAQGLQIYYRCSKVKLRGPQCGAAIYHLYKNDSDVVVEYRTKSDHTHDAAENSLANKLKLETKVEELVKLNVKPRRIMQELSEMEGIALPTFIQLKTLIAKIRKKIFGPVTISMSELSQLLGMHKVIPDSLHEPFVLCEEINMDSDEPYFRFLITTKHLLNTATLRNFSHSDTTYKCIWQGFPVFMIGTTDWDKAYHPYGLCVCSHEKSNDFKFLFQGIKNGVQNILNQKMEQKAVVCDAAFAIINAFKEVFGNDVVVVMCWFHAKVAMEEHLKMVKKENRQEILCDIEFLHIASTPEIFDNAAGLFTRKWESVEPEYCQYFESQWLNLHRNWYLGAVKHTPCHNNALESSNRYLKDINTIRIRHPLPHFLQIALQMVRNWSKDYTIGLKKFVTKPSVDLPLWTSSYNWARMNVSCKIVQDNKESTTVEVHSQVTQSRKGVTRDGITVTESSSDIITLSQALENRADVEKGTFSQSLANVTDTVIRSLSQSSADGAGNIAESSLPKRMRNREGVTTKSSSSKLKELGAADTVIRSLSQSSANGTGNTAEPSLPKRMRNREGVNMKSSSSKLTELGAADTVIRSLSQSSANGTGNTAEPSLPKRMRNREGVNMKSSSSKLTELGAADTVIRSLSQLSADGAGNTAESSLPKRMRNREGVTTKSSSSKLTELGAADTVVPSLSQSSSDVLIKSELKFDNVSKPTDSVIPNNFECYKKSFSKWTVTISKTDTLYKSRCNCPAYLKEYLCKHIIGLGIRFKLISVPAEAKTVPIGQKRKRGRPSKTKPALMIQ